MNISIDELKELLKISKGEIKEVRSITLRIITDNMDKLKHPIELEGIQQSPIKIKELGVYDMEGVKVWVVKK